MGLRTWWTEDRFEKWFQARFDRWINERFDVELDQRLQARDEAADGQFQGRFDALFGARFEAAFREQIKTWQDRGLPGFDAWVENFFDTLFTVYANTWGDSVNFQQRFDERFDEQFKERFEERLESEVRARVANELADRIDRRIDQWLVAVRQELIDAAGPDATEAAGHANTPATAAQLVQYLAKGPLQAQQIRKLLKGKQIAGERPTRYPLGEAAATLLLRKQRQPRASGPDTTQREDRSDS